ncbi:MAG: hypothetical protein ACOX0C_01345 [Patescibacteria group bacterium]|jgi:hypothetical protein
MFDYLQQFNRLPKELREKISTPEMINIISKLEEEYRLDLAALVMKVMVKIVSWQNLALTLVGEFNLSQTAAESLAKKLNEQVFSQVAGHLGLESASPSLSKEEQAILIIKKSAIKLSSSELEQRLKRIIITYLKGIRDKIAIQDTLAKSVVYGGLNLPEAEIQKIIELSDKFLHSPETTTSAVESKVASQPVSSSRLQEIMAQDLLNTPAEYDLKSALQEQGQLKAASRETPTLAPLDTSLQVKAPDKPETLKSPAQAQSLQAPIEAEKLAQPKERKAIAQPIKPESLSPISRPDKTLAEEPVKPTAPQASSPTPVPTLTKQELKSVPDSQQSAKVSKMATMFARLKFKRDKQLAPKSEAEKKVRSNKEAEALLSRPKEQVKPPAKKDLSYPLSAPGIAEARSLASAGRPATKPIVRDIKPMPRLMGPIEELKYLDLENFRRLGKTPAEIANKIIAKIKLLEGDGYDRMIKGIQAWRSSPVNALYLKMVKEAMAQGIPVKNLASYHDKHPNKYLSVAEIEEIISLNAKLIL